MDEGRVWRGGVSTEVDVRRLLDRFGRPEQGKKWSYSEVEDAIGVAKRETRFRTVTLAWRSVVYKLYNVVIGCETGHGFVVLQEPERVGLGTQWYRGAMRKMRRTQKMLSGCDDTKLSEVQRAERSHVERTVASLLLASRMEARRLPPPQVSPCGS